MKIVQQTNGERERESGIICVLGEYSEDTIAYAHTEIISEPCHAQIRTEAD